MLKHQYFQYLLNALLNWYNEANQDKENDLSILKSLKLLFLVTAADIELNKNNTIAKEDLLISNAFNNFCALPLGHVESDIYDYIKKNKGILPTFNINRITLTKLKDVIENQNEIQYKSIDHAISYLKKYFPKLISMRAYELVELTHKWNSWKLFYNTRYMASIPPEVIIGETKFFA